MKQNSLLNMHANIHFHKAELTEDYEQSKHQFHCTQEM